MMGWLSLPFVVFLAKANLFASSSDRSSSLLDEFFDFFFYFVAFLLKSIDSVSDDELDTWSQKTKKKFYENQQKKSIFKILIVVDDVIYHMCKFLGEIVMIEFIAETTPFPNLRLKGFPQL